MDNKQRKILDKILKDNSLPSENTFIQYRNLKEFRDFFIERVNPTHRILLYGKLKSPYIKDGHFNKVIKAGEILLCMGFFTVTGGLLLNTAMTIIIGVILLNFLLDYILDGGYFAYRNRGECWDRQNTLSCPLS